MAASFKVRSTTLMLSNSEYLVPCDWAPLSGIENTSTK